MNKHAQIAMEYLLITGFVMVILIPTLYFVVEYTGSAREDVAASRLNEIGVNIVSSAESIFFYGKHSKVTLDAFMPDGVTDMYIQCTLPHKEVCELVFETARGDMVFSTDFPLVGRRLEAINPSPTNPSILYDFVESEHSGGKKAFVLTTKQDDVVSAESMEKNDILIPFCEPTDPICVGLPFKPSSTDFFEDEQLEKYQKFEHIECSGPINCENYGAGSCNNGKCTYTRPYVELTVK